MGIIDTVTSRNTKIQNASKDIYRGMEKKIIAKKIKIVLASGVDIFYGISPLYKLVNKILVRSLESNSNEVIF